MMTELKKLLSEVFLIKAGNFLVPNFTCTGKSELIAHFFSLFTSQTFYFFIFYFFAVVAVSNFACGLYNRRLYEQAFTLAETLCKSYLKQGRTLLSVDRVRSLCAHMKFELDLFIISDD